MSKEKVRKHVSPLKNAEDKVVVELTLSDFARMDLELSSELDRFVVRLPEMHPQDYLVARSILLTRVKAIVIGRKVN